jgi:glycosyltransferase involved in cell wall biosynthesis
MKISAIVPVYNSEKYIERCVNSVSQQSYSNWELILVDDGSTDNSYDILCKLKESEPRIKVLHQKNSGPGIARNAGLSTATGDYIVFIDSDDVIKPDYFEKLSHETADVVFIDINQVDEDFRVQRKEHMSDYQSLPKDDLLRSQMTGKFPWGGWRKAVKTELLLKNKIRFTEHKVGEEAIYTFLLMYYAKSFSFIKGVVYEYVTRAGSQSDTKDDDPWGGAATAMKEKAMQLGLYEQYADTVNAFIVTAAIVSLDKMTEKYAGTEYRQKAKARVQRYCREVDKNYPVDTKHMDTKAKLMYPFLKAGRIMPICIASCMKRARRNR